MDNELVIIGGGPGGYAAAFLAADKGMKVTLIDGKVHAINEAGRVFIFDAAPAFRLLGKNDLGERVIASPAVVDGKLYVRGATHLYCIGNSPPR